MTNLKEALRVSQYIKMAKELLSDTGGDLDPTVLEQFIDYFGHIPGMAEAVEAARKYLDAVKDIPDELSNPEEAKTPFGGELISNIKELLIYQSNTEIVLVKPLSYLYSVEY